MHLWQHLVILCIVTATYPQELSTTCMVWKITVSSVNVCIHKWKEYLMVGWGWERVQEPTSSPSSLWHVLRVPEHCPVSGLSAQETSKGEPPHVHVLPCQSAPPRQLSASAAQMKRFLQTSQFLPPEHNSFNDHPRDSLTTTSYKTPEFILCPPSPG